MAAMLQQQYVVLLQNLEIGLLCCRREENGHNLDICVLRRLRLRQGQMQGFLGLKVGGGGS